MVPGIQGVIYGLAIILLILLAPEGLFWRVRDMLHNRDESRVTEVEDAQEKVEAAAKSTNVTPLLHSDRAERAATADIVLEVRNISKSFGGLQAVQDVSFSVRKGMILGIIGPNGAGKTTLFNLLNGFQRPDTGNVIVGGTDLVRRKPHALCRAGIGRTFQVMRPFKRMTIYENVRVGAYVKATSEADAERIAREAVAMVGLADSADRVAGGLTTKELRLMELARALAGQPDILLLDETLAGLGSDESEEVVAVIRQLADAGKTIVIIEHTMQAMVKLVDRFLVLDHGEIVTEGLPEEVTRDSRVIEAYLGKKWAANA